MKINQIKEQPDGSAIIEAEMSKEEQDMLFRAGLQETMEETHKVMKPCDLPEGMINGLKTIEISDLDYQTFINIGMITALKSVIKNDKISVD